MEQSVTGDYMVIYSIGFDYYDQETDQERHDGIPQIRHFKDIHEARRYVFNLPDECEDIRIYQLVEEIEDDR